jgi:hypothetical protein
LKTTSIPSPARWSIVPSCRKTSSPSAAWYAPKTAIASSGSTFSENAVDPRRSQYSAATWRR